MFTLYISDFFNIGREPDKSYMINLSVFWPLLQFLKQSLSEKYFFTNFAATEARLCAKKSFRQNLSALFFSCVWIDYKNAEHKYPPCLKFLYAPMFWNFFISIFAKTRIFSINFQRCIQNLVKHLRWSPSYILHRVSNTHLSFWN